MKNLWENAAVAFAMNFVIVGLGGVIPNETYMVTGWLCGGIASTLVGLAIKFRSEEPALGSWLALWGAVTSAGMTGYMIG